MLPPPSGAATGSDRGVEAHPAMTEDKETADLRKLDERLLSIVGQTLLQTIQFPA